LSSSRLKSMDRPAFHSILYIVCHHDIRSVTSKLIVLSQQLGRAGSLKTEPLLQSRGGFRTVRVRPAVRGGVSGCPVDVGHTGRGKRSPLRGCVLSRLDGVRIVSRVDSSGCCLPADRAAGGRWGLRPIHGRPRAPIVRRHHHGESSCGSSRSSGVGCMLRGPITCSPTAVAPRLLSGSVVVRGHTSDHVAKWSAVGGVCVGGSGAYGSGYGGAVGVAGGCGAGVVVAVVRV